MNILKVVQQRTAELVKENRSTFNTNEFLLETLLNKEISRKDVIDLIIAKRIELSGVDVEAMKDEDLGALIEKTHKTSKNGLDTSVSNSENNSSFSYNERFKDYELIKNGRMLSVIKRKK